MNASELPAFPPDFAERVLARADRLALRRRRLASGAFLVSLVALISWAGFSTRDTASLPSPVQAARMSSPDDQTDALALMFPDAAPVARFAAGYSDEAGSSGSDFDMLPSGDDSGPP